MRGRRPRQGRIRRPVTLVAVIAIALLVALLLPAIPAAREAARRAQCNEHLHAIGVALQAYHDRYKSFPPAYVADGNGRRMHSWRVLILRELGYETLYTRYRFDEPWDGPHNRSLIAEMPKEFGCPSDSSKSPGETNYVAVVGCQTGWPAPFAVAREHVGDGLYNTVHVVESCDLRASWTEPRDITWGEYVRGVNSGQHPGIFSRHPGGALCALMAGEVRFFSDKMDRKILRRYGTIDGSHIWPGAPCDAVVDYADDSGLVLRSASDLGKTDVLPVLDTPLVPGRNLVYCSSFQIGWDALRDVLGVDSVPFADPPQLAEQLNARRFPREALSTECYVVAAGRASDGIRERFVASRRQKFPNATLPEPPPTEGASLEVYCYLQKRLPFQVKFGKLDDPLQFQTPEGIRPVRSWGLRPGQNVTTEPQRFADGRAVSPDSQVQILDYVDDEDFVLQLITLSDPIVLAKVKPLATLDETWRAVAERVRHPRTRGKRASLFFDEPLVVPEIALFIERDFHELIGSSVTGAGPIAAAKEYVKFQLDESGAKLEAEDATLTVGIDRDDQPPDRPRQFVFDRPFLLALRQPKAEDPYFVLWIGNVELLIGAADQAPFQADRR